jgi:hypothetical protein
MSEMFVLLIYYIQYTILIFESQQPVEKFLHISH